MFLNNTIPVYINQFVQSQSGAFASDIVAATIVIVASVVLAFIADILFEKVFMHYAAKTRYDCDDLIVDALKKPIFYTVAFVGAFIAAEIVFPGNAAIEIIMGLLLTCLSILWIFALLKINKILFKHVLSHLVRKTDTKMDDELLPLFKNIVDVLLVFFGILAILKGVWDADILPLFASAGIVGLAVAFAAQDTISQLFGGISIYFDQPFKPGDRIEIDDGEIGIVQEVGIRSTRIKNLYNNMIVIPNSIIANSKVTNYTSPEESMMVKVTIGVAYGSDVEKVRGILTDIAKSVNFVLDDPVPYVRFDNHGDFSLDFAIIMWVTNPGEKFTVINEVNTKINAEFEKEGIEIPFPVRTIIQQKPE
ncbi:mechanosensitive ion channel family protein [Methanolobus sediminis]|uniref:Mechanosensitive ion channel family protein n=1 Tax=Methanolobus sediminis TaxID=3072978 RepID=A0AA51YIL9_9EURY|nr:mechanosensitive ion channel family protein [Methanolobus sediminis]WMW24670.1 mechanosensitive ion channel family protein [Methanolobus sediminis]